MNDSRNGGRLSTSARGSLFLVAIVLPVLFGLLGIHTLGPGFPASAHVSADMFSSIVGGASGTTVTETTGATMDGRSTAAGQSRSATTGQGHSSAIGPNGSSPITAEKSVHSAPATHSPTLMGACIGGPCGAPMHDHTAVMLLCFLALLAAALVLAIPGPHHLLAVFARALRTPHKPLARTQAPSRPPSLHLLSISRT